MGRQLEAQSRLGVEHFAFDPASNLIDPHAQREADREHLPRPKALDNLLKQYAGTHYQYDARGNLTQRWRNGEACRYTWDLFDRLTHAGDGRLEVSYTYDALGRRLSKHSQAHYQARREARPHWNRSERVKRNCELLCGFTLYGCDSDTLASESRIADEDGLRARHALRVRAGPLIENGQAQTYEVTSMTADKRLQVAKEDRILDAGGTFVRDRATGDLVPVSGPSRIRQLP